MLTLAPDNIMTDGTVIAESSPVDLEEFPASNVLTQAPSQRWRSLDVDDAYIVIDLLTEKSIDFVGLAGVKISNSGGAYWRVGGGASVADAKAGVIFDTEGLLFTYVPSVESYPNLCVGHKLDEIYSCRYLAFYLADPDNTDPDAFIELGRAYASKCWEPVEGIQMVDGWGLKFVDLSEIDETPGGQACSSRAEKVREITFTASFMEEDEAMLMAYEIDRIHGSSTPLIVSKDPNDVSHAGRWTVYGRIAALEEIHTLDAYWYRKPYRVREVI